MGCQQDGKFLISKYFFKFTKNFLASIFTLYSFRIICWKVSIAEPMLYVRLFGPDHKTHIETMNPLIIAATLRSEVPALIPRFLLDAPINFEIVKMFQNIE